MLAGGRNNGIAYARINESRRSLVDEKVGHERYKATDEIPHANGEGGNVHPSVRDLL